MIFWKDFILDDIVGPILAMPEERSKIGGREERLGSPDARNGASGTNTAKAEIQETRQEQRPARMVGHSSHDSAQVDRTSAGSNRAETLIKANGGEGL